MLPDQSLYNCAVFPILYNTICIQHVHQINIINGLQCLEMSSERSQKGPHTVSLPLLMGSQKGHAYNQIAPVMDTFL